MKKKKNENKSRDYSKILTVAIIAVVTFSLAMSVGYYFGYQDAKSDFVAQYNDEKRRSAKSIAKLRKIVDKEALSSKELNDKLKKLLKEQQRETLASAQHEYAESDKKQAKPPKAHKREVVTLSDKPKLAIIIDDVSFERDVKAIKSLDMDLTMSFLPPTKIHPNSAKLASREAVYMVHLPLEASNFHAEESSTLRVSDSQQRISSKIREIKQLFPAVKYINNHTGSKFTADERSMNRLIYALKKNGIRFIDSRTTADTKAPKVMKNFGYQYVARDVFLDHVNSVSAVKKQLERAVTLAKRHGSAIAIGHPHKATLRALRESSALLNDVQLVQIDKI